MKEIKGLTLSVGDLIIYSDKTSMYYALVIGSTKIFTMCTDFYNFKFNFIIEGKLKSVHYDKVVSKVNVDSEYLKKIYHYLAEGYKRYSKENEIQELNDKNMNENLKCGDIILMNNNSYMYLGLCESEVTIKETINNVIMPSSSKTIYPLESAHTYLHIHSYCFKEILSGRNKWTICDICENLEKVNITTGHGIYPATLIRLKQKSNKKIIYKAHVDLLFDSISNLRVEKQEGNSKKKYCFNLCLQGE